MKLIVGRNEGENALLTQYAEASRYRLEAAELMGSVALVEGQANEAERALCSRIVARYGKGKDLPQVCVEWRLGEALEHKVTVEPFRDDAGFDSYRL